MSPVIGITVSTLRPTIRVPLRRFANPEAYAHATRAGGATPLLLPNLDPGDAAACLDRLDGLLLSGGADVDPVLYGEEPHLHLGEVDAVRDRFELALLAEARQREMPVFAICRGLQVLNVGYGGTLIQHIPSQVPRALQHAQKVVRIDTMSHGIEIVDGTRLAAIAAAASGGQGAVAGSGVGDDGVRVNSYHHQAPARVGEGLVVSARASDGVIEGLEDPRHPFLVGVQWHPERLPGDPFTRGLFQAFVEAARSRQGAAAGA